MHARSQDPRGRTVRIVVRAVALLAATLIPLVLAGPACAGTLDRVSDTGRLRLGYRIDARPFSYRDESGNAAGYSVALCQKIADRVKAELALPALTVEWVPVILEGRFLAVQQGRIDLLCGADSVTLERRKEVSFSIPIFPGGVGAVLRADAPFGLRDALSGRLSVHGNASQEQNLQQQTFSVIADTTSQRWLADRLEQLQIGAKVVPVQSYEAGIQRVLDRGSSAFFGDRAILWDVAKRRGASQDLTILDRHFTYEPIALALARGDEDFRLIVDRTLSVLFASPGLRNLYAAWLGEPDEETLTFFRLTALPK